MTIYIYIYIITFQQHFLAPPVTTARVLNGGILAAPVLWIAGKHMAAEARQEAGGQSEQQYILVTLQEKRRKQYVALCS